MADRRDRTQRKRRQTVPLANLGLVQPRDRRLRHEPQSRQRNGEGNARKSRPRLTDKGTMLHSDQGVLYRTAGYRELLAEHSMVQSMSRKANCWDYAPMESFFAVLKTECFYNAGELTVDELMKQIDDYMDYYNRERCSLKLKKLSPVAYRTQLAQSA